MRVSDQLVRMVQEANPHRSPENIYRRLLKVLEELGESAEACLSVTSPHNYKNKSWADYREEAADTLIVLIDVALTEVDNFPPASLIPMMVNIATTNSFETLDQLYQSKFQVAGAISAAAQHLASGDTMGFHGAIHRGITAASNMCFARMPEDDNPEIIEIRVHDIFTKKIEKWNSNLRLYAAADDGISK